MNIPGLEEQDQISLLVVATPVCWAREKMHLTLVPIDGNVPQSKGFTYHVIYFAIR